MDPVFARTVSLYFANMQHHPCAGVGVKMVILKKNMGATKYSTDTLGEKEKGKKRNKK